MRDRDDFRNRFETRNQTSSAVKTASAGEVDRAIAKLVLAFNSATDATTDIRTAIQSQPAPV
jgi:hypothetical protein